MPCRTRLGACTLFPVADHNYHSIRRGLAYAVGASDLWDPELPRSRNPDRGWPRYNWAVPLYSPPDLYLNSVVRVGWRHGKSVARCSSDGGVGDGRSARADVVRGTTSGATLP